MNNPPVPGRDFYIRKLTPRECFRLMDVSENDINKIMAYPLTIPDNSNFNEWLASLNEKDRKVWEKKHISKSQCYKLAGNSICVGMLTEVFRQMFRPVYYEDVIVQASKKTTKRVIETNANTQLSLFDMFDFDEE